MPFFLLLLIKDKVLILLVKINNNHDKLRSLLTNQTLNYFENIV